MTSTPVPTTQRAHRAPLPRRATGRVAASGEHLGWLAPRLTPRDRWLARMLAEHRVLTSAQIAELAFPSRHAANTRLLALYRWRVVDRFQPYTGRGSAYHHYVLDTAGAALLAHEDGIDPGELRWRHEQAIGVAHSLRLAHTVAVNGFFTALVHTARLTTADLSSADPPGAGLTAWWPEDRCARHFADHARPDAYGRWSEPGSAPRGPGAAGGGELEFFLEHDQGTENHPQLAAKLAGYAALAAATGIITPVLFRFRTTTREIHARRTLAAALGHLDRPDAVPTATSAADHPRHPAHHADPDPAGSGPAGPVWLPIHPDHRHGPPDQPGRTRLARLPAAWPGLRPPTTAGQGQAPGSQASGTPGRVRLAPPPPMPPAPDGAGDPTS